MEVFFDQENIQGGDIWFKDIGNALQTSKVCLVFVGEEGVGACQKKVLVAIIQHTEDDDSCKIIPVILASQNHCAKLPWFLTNYQWIVFESATNGNALEQLKTA